MSEKQDGALRARRLVLVVERSVRRLYILALKQGRYGFSNDERRFERNFGKVTRLTARKLYYSQGSAFSRVYGSCVFALVCNVFDMAAVYADALASGCRALQRER